MNDNNITPEEVAIIKKAQSGNEAAFSQLFHRYKDFVDKLLFLYIRDMDEAKDIANVVFLRVHEKLSTFTNYESFGGWLRILTKNVAIDYLRTVRDSTSLDYTPGLANINVADTEDDYVNRYYNEDIIDMINGLPVTYRDPMRLFYIQDYSIEDICKTLNASAGTIKSALCRSRRILRKKLIKGKDNAEPSDSGSDIPINIRDSTLQQEQ